MYYQSKSILGGEGPCGGIVNGLDCNTVVSEFDL